jgi:cephalosporin-C deacetylase-like acetyl esterase
MRLLIFAAVSCLAATSFAQEYGQPDRASPGDAMIQSYLKQEELKLSAKYADDIKSLEAWKAKREQYVEEYYYMLGLSPRPDKTPLQATITGKVEGDGYVVENLHYQSRPRLYVTGNLYRPAKVKAGEKLPAVFYVCGHSGRGRHGNKVAFQSHGIWFARHGYVCLVVDTLQLGEIGATHHGTYNLERWWWHSRGYTPAGVECWNGVRGIDYLVSRPDVDPDKIAVTGISGGGAATFWIAAADERVKVAVPVSGMADLQSYVPQRVINGHCDCMFLYNTFQWPWTRIANLVAPRPMLFVNSDQDPIFPMDANDRIINRLERLYSLYDASDRVDAVVSVGGHAYRADIRQAEYRFINAHLRGDAREVTDSELDVVSEGREPGKYPIDPEKLRVFPTDADLPKDELNTKIDEHFVPLAKVELPEKGKFDEWKKKLVAELKRVSFASFPETITAAKPAENGKWQTEEGIEIDVKPINPKGGAKSAALIVANSGVFDSKDSWLALENGYLVMPRGWGNTRWTRKNGPNYVERSHALLGRTADTGRVLDVISVARRLKDDGYAVHIHGEGQAAIIAAYAALLEPSIERITLRSPPMSHMDPAAPQILNALRVCDIPDVLGMLAPRELKLVEIELRPTKVMQSYEAASAKLIIGE